MWYTILIILGIIVVFSFIYEKKEIKELENKLSRDVYQKNNSSKHQNLTTTNVTTSKTENKVDCKDNLPIDKRLINPFDVHNGEIDDLAENTKSHRQKLYERDLQNVTISEEFIFAFEHIEHTDNNIFVTGKAGTGKSTFLKYLLTETRKNAVALAYTGVAALNIQGSTIHSFFKFPPHALNPNNTNEVQDPSLYRNLDLIIIDEISMVRADLLDAIDSFMRNNGKDRNKPFGGVQMVFIGDLYQLPPIVKGIAEKQYFQTVYRSPWFFDAHVFDITFFKVIEFLEVFRQSDIDFISMLDAFRIGKYSDEQLAKINQRVGADINNNTDDFPIILTATNETANIINAKNLASINETKFTYYGITEGTFPQDNLPAPSILQLKKGAQVIFVKNDSMRRWVNGTLGIISDLSEDTIEVETVDNNLKCKYFIGKEEWEKYEHSFSRGNRFLDATLIGKYTQYPIKLAWAITIHKSQGLTFNNVDLDLGNGAFTTGQAYVALSRCRSLNGISLRKLLCRNDIKTDNRVNIFFEEATYA